MIAIGDAPSFLRISSSTAFVIRAEPVHLVDIGEAGNPVPIGLVPHGLGLRLHPVHRRKDRDGAVQDAQGSLHLRREVDVAGSIDDVY